MKMIDQKDEIVNEEVKKKDKLLSPPFPKALQSRKVVNNATEIFEVLKQVKVNIPLLDMIKQVLPMPSSLKIYPIASELTCSILGPFLATTNALINCRNGVMQLTFGNMTLELNIFHLCKRHPNQDEDEQEEACLIDTLIEEHVEGIMEEEMEKAYENLKKLNKRKN
ncbi:hypothetical protein CK203_096154 [Vitis vinifera]|uniref:Uncharacterized protein n=1 Tax=Vitis vinifera TaxID=29760 RepID=A0A438DV19_VITVI|nr:hypothetical protein CK203_096154 [Vitis vinifera]